MTREIKFRVWSEEHKAMGYLGLFNEGYFIDKEGVGVDYDSEVPVMQYTGLKDKNGKEIYEGDIVKHDWGVTGPDIQVTHVVWDIGECGEACFTYAASRYDWPGLLYPQEWEIIGNIYENPELLKLSNEKLKKAPKSTR